ncbi:DUF1345 domain-containing protein [Xanthobacter sp. AM11]|uniref:DUF1345 domain-containing protein n=1 Tax=Xanthobacter sp. AM11 TaxID=3380643 RepID=UPI0039BF3F1C
MGAGMVVQLVKAARRSAAMAAGAVRVHPRLFLALAAGTVVFVALAALLLRTRFLIAFDVTAAAWLVMALRLVLRCDAGAVRRRAEQDDEGAWVALVVVLAVTATSLVAIVIEAAGAAHDGGPHIALAGGTLVLSWLFFHSVFAFHYAHEFYDDDKPDARPMLGFPGPAEPDYWDFLYFSFNLGTASQTADVTVNSPRLRRFVLLHQVASYVFNATIIALGVNVAATLM